MIFYREKQYQDAVGKRPPSIVATDLTREAKKYEEAHNKASESNQALHKAITMHVKNLKILAQPLADLMAHIPSPSIYLSGNTLYTEFTLFIYMFNISYKIIISLNIIY